MNPVIEWIAALVMSVFGTTLIYLVRAVGKYKGHEINSIGGVTSLIYNPLNWIKLYRIFFQISGEQRSSTYRLTNLLILNLVAFCSMVLLLAYIIPKQ